ncbi:Prefoldin subunit [Teratosphaeria destructans]|uniref:Prefoldin subunit n=1 Tax=Teratosphaeria destructans TaxID=418781 RepID=A0A9W7W3Q1_9PEZI|nr:Prefoldin subunit [Teratosphaeria destructans]
MDLVKVEQQRQALEKNLRELRQSLKYWQTFEAEYEGLKEAILEAQPNVDSAKLTEISKTYDGDLVTEQIILELSGLGRSSPRTGQQIVRDIERRQEYVQKNVEIIQRRFFNAEAKLEEFDFAATRDSETGLPLTEILEELDDDDNVISSSLSQPEVQHSRLVEALKKAGLSQDDLASGESEKPLKPAITNANLPPSAVAAPAPALTIEKRAKSTNDIPLASGDSTSVDFEGPDRPPLRKKVDSEDGKKTVSFAEKVAVAPAAPPPDTRSVSFSPKVEEIPVEPLGATSPQVAAQAGAATPESDSEAQKELRASFKPGDRVKTLDDDDDLVKEEIVAPEGESEEDAQTRREMLDYHLNEVGHIVAEMDLAEGLGDDYDKFDDADYEDDDTSSHYTGSTYLEDEDTPYTSGMSDEEDEDEHGRTKGKVISDDYHKQMLAMQERLIGNLGPAPKDGELRDIDGEIDPADVRRLVIRGENSSVSSIASDSSDKKKKRVSFAESVDVAQPVKAQKTLPGENAAPVTDIVSERNTESNIALPPTPTKTASMFKKSREEAAEQPRVDEDGVPLGPAGRTLAENLVERPVPEKRNKAPSPDDADPIAERRQLAAEYYRRRNEMVRQQGGFKVDREEDEALGELMEERDGKLKKVSRFKAARLK